MRLKWILIMLGLFFIGTQAIAQMGHCSMGTEHHHAEISHSEEELGTCPVMGGAASKDYSYTHEGKTYYFCCPWCIDEFKKNPEKYASNPNIKEVSIEAYQFGFSPEQIILKKGDIIKILAVSRDVTHGIYIKEYNINVPVKKGNVTEIEFTADKTGEFDILCSVYCGHGHNSMKAKLIVEE